MKSIRADDRLGGALKHGLADWLSAEISPAKGVYTGANGGRNADVS